MYARHAVAMTVIVIASMTIAACAPEKAPEAASTPEVAAMPAEPAAEMARLLNEFDPVALGNLITEDARLLAPNIPAIEGRAAIVEYYDGVVDEKIRYEAAPLRSVLIGNVGITEGEYHVKNLNTDTNVESGKYMAVWVNQAGQWRIARLMTNTDAQVARTTIEIEDSPQ
jgi:ketosteroid isomerase-like protein